MRSEPYESKKTKYYVEKCLRYGRILRNIQDALVKNGYDVEHQDPEVLPEIIMKNIKKGKYGT